MPAAAVDPLPLPPPLPLTNFVPTQSDTSNQPLRIAKGINGIVELYPQFVRIRRKGAMAFLSQGIKGDKDIQLTSITAIQLKMPGWTNGLIKFVFPGSHESKAGLNDALKDDNTVMFRGGHRTSFVELRDAIQRLQGGDSIPAEIISSSRPLAAKTTKETVLAFIINHPIKAIFACLFLLSATQLIIFGSPQPKQDNTDRKAANETSERKITTEPRPAYESALDRAIRKRREQEERDIKDLTKQIIIDEEYRRRYGR